MLRVMVWMLLAWVFGAGVVVPVLIKYCKVSRVRLWVT